MPTVLPLLHCWDDGALVADKATGRLIDEGKVLTLDLVVPIPQRRGLFRYDYQGRTLRDHLGIEPVAAMAPLLAAAGDGYR